MLLFHLEETWDIFEKTRDIFEKTRDFFLENNVVFGLAERVELNVGVGHEMQDALFIFMIIITVHLLVVYLLNLLLISKIYPFLSSKKLIASTHTS